MYDLWCRRGVRRTGVIVRGYQFILFGGKKTYLLPLTDKIL